MKITEVLTYIESKNSLGIVPGLENILALLEKLGHPELAVPALHIAGTNGKGTIMAFVEQALLAGGLRVGRYLSPAVTDYREKWQLDGRMVTEGELSEVMDEVRNAAEEMPVSPTAFEIETAAAFLLFKKQNCDVMLIECGMGGRLDATNVLPSKVVDILASVSMDHMQFLGDTREKILQEKLGIVREGDVLVTSPLDSELREIFDGTDSETNGAAGSERKNRIESQMSDLTILKETVEGTEFLFRGIRYRIQMPGKVAVENALTALTALEVYNLRAKQFGLPVVSEEAIRTGLEKTVWQGRFTVFRTFPEMIVDGAHNRDAWLRLSETLKYFYGEKKLIFLLGVLADKEVDQMLKTLLPMAKRVYTFTPDSPRALEAEKLAEQITSYDIPVNVVPDAVSGAREALRGASAGDTIVACGSLTFLGELLASKKRLEMDRVERIIRNSEYRDQIKKIYESEFDREYCRHGFGHAVSVARIAYILCGEERRHIRKDVIYGMALLHDIGRYTPEEKNMSHHEAGAVVAEPMLREAGYTEEEIREMCNAISSHRDPSMEPGALEDVLYRADKLSRNCFLCDAREDCYWPEERKNQTILF